MKTSRGSITVYLCLSLTLVVALFAAMLQSVRSACGRAMIAQAAETGLYSLFAQYDRQLLEDYDLFFINGGKGDGQLKIGQLYDTIYDAAEKSMDPYGHGNHRNFCGVGFSDGSITSFSLATDQTGNSFAAQVSDYMKKRLGVLGIQKLSQISDSQNKNLADQEQGLSQIPDQDPLATYDQQLADGGPGDTDTGSDMGGTDGNTGNQGTGEAGADPGGSGSGEGDFGTADGEGTAALPEVETPDRNPIDVIREIREMGILGIVMEHPEELSTADLSAELPSARTLEQGMGALTAQSASIGDKILMQEYLIDKFPNYRSQVSTGGLQYQLEYAIVGKDSDRENLKSVVDQLLLTREGANMLYLYGSPSKKAEADALAAGIAAAFAIPVAQPVIALALISCWAFAESILDVRELLAGGKIALIKDDTSWQLAVENIGKLLDGMDSYRKNIDGGLDYEGYLRMLLLLKSQEKLTKSAMDLVEYNMNLKNPEQVFHIDSCVGAIETESEWMVFQRSYTIRKSYSYLDKDA